MELTEFKDGGYFSVYCCRREPIEKRQQKGKNKSKQTRAQRCASLKSLNVVNQVFRVLIILDLNCISLNTLR